MEIFNLDTPLEHSTYQSFTIEDTVPKKHHPMLDETKSLLKNFFEPFNNQLSKLLDSRDFLWESY